MRRLVSAAVLNFFVASICYAQTIYPVDRAEFLAGSRFDFKVEFPGLVSEKDIRVTINGVDSASVLGKSATSSRRKTARTCPRFCFAAFQSTSRAPTPCASPRLLQLAT